MMTRVRYKVGEQLVHVEHFACILNGEQIKFLALDYIALHPNLICKHIGQVRNDNLYICLEFIEY